MKRRTYILVLRNDSTKAIDLLKAFSESMLEDGDIFFRLDYNVAFFQSLHDVETLTARLRKIGLTGAYFFLADITDTSRAGNMVPEFWDMLHGTGMRTPAAADA
jgi:hypothetical protein